MCQLSGNKPSKYVVELGNIAPNKAFKRDSQRVATLAQVLVFVFTVVN